MSGGAEAVRVVCRCRPARSELLRGHGQGGFDGRTDEERAGGLVKVKVKKPPAPTKDSKRPSTSGGLAGQQSHSLDSLLGVKFHGDGKSISVLEEAATVGNTKETTRARPHLFTYDHVFDPNCTQADIYDVLARDTVDAVLHGYNGSIFAYGQTGSGKTYTMFGPSHASPELQGVIPRCAEQLFAALDGIEDVEEVTIKCSFLEIYKEVIQDLLNPSNTNLRIREDKSGDVYVQGLSDEYVSSAQDILHLLAIGEKSRTVASTDMNEVSSRSHSVLIIVVTQKLTDGSTRVGKLNMADLAGSERIERTNATGVTLEEAKMINQSLSALGNCIHALTDAKRTHVPFRDSTLTFLLKDSLGGNTKTTLLVCCSGEESDIAETLSTLNFAKRAKRIKNTVTVNTVLGVQELTAMVEQLRRELGLALRQIIALQRLVKLLRDGGEVDDAMVDQLMRPPALAPPGKEAPKEADGRVEDRPVSPVGSADTSAYVTPAVTVPQTPALSPTHSTAPSPAPSQVSSPTARDASVSPPAEEVSESAESNGAVDIAQIREMISAAKEEAQAVTNEIVDGSVPPPSEAPAVVAESVGTGDAAVISALQEQLERERAQYRKKAKQWHLENSQLRVEKEMLRVSARASDALISNLSTTVKSQREREARRAARAAAADDITDHKESPPSSDDDRDTADATAADGSLAELLDKNERLERQVAEMKETWGAYLDLILENQKVAAAKKERKERERQEERERRERDLMLFSEPAYHPAHRTRIVKPVRVGDGARFFSPPKVAVPVGASPLALTTPMKEEEEGKEASPSPPTSASVSKYSTGRTPSPALTGSTITAVQARAATPSSSSANASPGHTPNSSITSSILSSLLDSAATPMHLHKPPSPYPGESSSLSPLSSPGSATVNRSTLQDVLKRGYLSKKQMGWSMSMSANKAWRRRLFLLRPHCLDYYETSTPYPVPAPPSPSLPSADHSPSPPPFALGGGGALGGSLTGALRGTIPLDSTTMVRVVEYGDVPWGFEIVTRDKEAKLHAASGEERDEWVEEVKRAVYRIRKSAGMKDEEIERLELMQTQSERENDSGKANLIKNIELMATPSEPPSQSQ